MRAAGVAEGALRAGGQFFCRTHTARGSFSSQSQASKCVILFIKNLAPPFKEWCKVGSCCKMRSSSWLATKELKANTQNICLWPA